jgi:hypothetical protein
MSRQQVLVIVEDYWLASLIATSPDSNVPTPVSILLCSLKRIISIVICLDNLERHTCSSIVL